MPRLNPYGVYDTEPEAVAALDETTLDLAAYPLHLFCLHDLDGTVLGYETSNRLTVWDSELEEALRNARIRFIARKEFPHHRWRRCWSGTRTVYRDSGNTGG